MRFIWTLSTLGALMIIGACSSSTAGDCTGTYLEGPTASLEGLKYVSLDFCGFPTEKGTFYHPPLDRLSDAFEGTRLRFGTKNSYETDRSLGCADLAFRYVEGEDSATITGAVWQKVALLRNSAVCLRAATWEETATIAGRDPEALADGIVAIIDSLLLYHGEANHDSIGLKPSETESR